MIENVSDLKNECLKHFIAFREVIEPTCMFSIRTGQRITHWNWRYTFEMEKRGELYHRVVDIQDHDFKDGEQKFDLPQEVIISQCWMPSESEILTWALMIPHDGEYGRPKIYANENQQIL